MTAQPDNQQPETLADRKAREALEAGGHEGLHVFNAVDAAAIVSVTRDGHSRVFSHLPGPDLADMLRKVAAEFDPETKPAGVPLTVLAEALHGALCQHDDGPALPCSDGWEQLARIGLLALAGAGLRVTWEDGA